MKWLLNAFWLVLCLLLGVGIVFFSGAQRTHTPTTQSETCRHQLSLDQCAFCDSSLIETLGFCRGHGVPEAKGLARLAQKLLKLHV